MTINDLIASTQALDKWRADINHALLKAQVAISQGKVDDADKHTDEAMFLLNEVRDIIYELRTDE